MSLTDPIADLLTRILNATAVKHESMSIPCSKLKLSIVSILKKEGFIKDYEVIKKKPQSSLKIFFTYRDEGESPMRGLKKISKPGLRVHVSKGEIPRVYGGIGISIMSTSKGIMTGQEARRQNTGGELLCYVW